MCTTGTTNQNQLHIFKTLKDHSKIQSILAPENKGYTITKLNKVPLGSMTVFSNVHANLPFTF